MKFGNIKSIKMKIMKFYNILSKIRPIVFLIICMVISGTISAQGQKEKRVKEKVDLTMKVVDQDGLAIPQAQIIVGEGFIYAETDGNGSYSFKAFPEDNVSVSKSAYEKIVTRVAELIKNNSVMLYKSKLFMTTNDEIPLPFINLKKRNISGSSNVIWGNQLDKFPSTDIRNSFTGLMPGLEVIERNGAPGSTPEENLGVFGINSKIDINSPGI